jgi:uncharacterized OB-fold protein
MLLPQKAGIPLPHPTPVSQPFWDGCALGELRYQRCRQCGRALFNPTSVCRWCGSDSLAWELGQGRGSVYSWSVVWRPQSTAFHVPYAAVIVDLDEGYQMLSGLIGCEHDEVDVGMRVAVEFHAAGEMTLPYFSPDRGPGQESARTE